MSLTVRIIRPSSREKDNSATDRVAELKRAGFNVSVGATQADPRWSFAAATVEDRAQELIAAIDDPSVDVVWIARGGYGASDLLPHLPWDRWATRPAKVIVGYSDVSALHSAFWAKLGWNGLHAPMPLHESWGRDGERRDVDASMVALREGGTFTITTRGDIAPTEGWLFGGCFSVLTSLIGTPFFPKSLAGAIVFLEDIDENGGRVMRAFNQWSQSGSLNGVRAIVLGRFPQHNDPERLRERAILDEITRRSPVPVVVSDDFGHITPNMPLMVGSRARVAGGELTWSTHTTRGTVS